MTSLTVMTFNIRYDEEADGRHAWRYRRDLVRDAITAHDPDLLGVQEPMPHQWHDLTAALPALSRLRSAGDESDDDEPVGGFFRTSRLEWRDGGTFWLSATPAVPHSTSWPHDYGARLCRWAKLRDRLAQRDIVFACTHFDTNVLASLPSAKVLHAELDAVAAAAPIVVVGDFNCAAGSGAHQYLRDVAAYRDAWTDAGHADEGVVTFNGFSAADGARDTVAIEHGNYRIDWILLRGPIACTSAEIDTRRPGGLPPSDHYPVIATIEWE
jgi:endonuclease/exonuclease/phosphatase family metal-dependent hydrolase